MSRKLVAYFSATGRTAKVAKTLSEACDADLYEIKPAVPYTSGDLNWHDDKARSTVEMKDSKSRPALADKNANVEDYDVIFVGFPVWWYVAPTIINTFLESYDFSGKKIVLFATSGGSNFGKTADNLKQSVSPTATIREGRLLNGRPTKEELADWVKSLCLC